MLPKVTENYTRVGVDVGRIVHRILSHLSPDILDGLNEVRLLENHNHAFACYKKDEAAIEIYMAVGHELDHHLNRDDDEIDREASAEENIMKYVYPSLGIFKPTVRIVSFFCLPFRRSGEKQISDSKNG